MFGSTGTWDSDRRFVLNTFVQGSDSPVRAQDDVVELLQKTRRNIHCFGFYQRALERDQHHIAHTAFPHPVMAQQKQNYVYDHLEPMETSSSPYYLPLYQLPQVCAYTN